MNTRFKCKQLRLSKEGVCTVRPWALLPQDKGVPFALLCFWEWALKKSVVVAYTGLTQMQPAGKVNKLPEAYQQPATHTPYWW